MKMMFMDTVGLIAMWDSSDHWHVVATSAFSRLSPSNVRIVTTSSVLHECGNAAARRPYRLLVDQFRSRLIKTDGLIVPTELDEEKAWTNYHSGRPGAAGIVDHISLVVMRRLGITDAFTNDAHFKAAGFSTLF